MREKIIWIIAGVAFVALAFVIPRSSQGIWQPVIWGTMAAVIFVVAFAGRWVREISSQFKQGFIYGVLAVLIISLSAFAYYQYTISQFQREILNANRLYIEKVQAMIYVREPLLKTFRDYYRKNEENRSIGELYKSKYDSLIDSDNLYHYPHYEIKSLLKIHVSKLTPDSVVLVGKVSTKGRGKEFVNLSGSTGHYKVKGILTKKGIRYEREN